jgi:hypothetical protein
MNPADRHADVPALIAGLVVIALGVLLLLDHLGALHLSFGYLWPALIGTVGAVLLTTGISRSRSA